MNHIVHKFGPNETIQGIIKKYNKHDMEKSIVELLMDQFNKLNGPEKKVPRIGETYKIPLYNFSDVPLTVKEIITPKKLQAMPQPPEAPIIQEAHLADVIPIMSRKEKIKDFEAEANAIINRQQRREKNRKEKGLPVHAMEISEAKKALKEKIREFKEEDYGEIKPKKKITKKTTKKVIKKTSSVTEKSKKATIEKATNDTLPIKSAPKKVEKKERQIPHTRKKHTRRRLDMPTEKKDNKPKPIVHTRIIRNRRTR